MGFSWPCQNQHQGPGLVLPRCHRAAVPAEPQLVQAGTGTAPLRCQEPSRRQLMPRAALLRVSPTFPGWHGSLSPLAFPQAEGPRGSRAQHPTQLLGRGDGQGAGEVAADVGGGFPILPLQGRKERQLAVEEPSAVSVCQHQRLPGKEP